MTLQIERPLPFVPAHCFDDEPFTVTADEAFMAYELTDEQARDWVTSQPCFAHLTVNAVLMSDRLRVLAARHAMKVMQ
ncbi:MAG: hypothetical protein Unbinned338contig1000_11 [Prokaryotic dsDNA virus sp.]|nr:MAG: hypothetical protein Unbinned338contig1000_11 [Prokaryotic dsDNA virus sp.]|tara:strand:- start:3315 stop:3548 length:234 start_codon:yes stop_codon:yes gene_type:complete